MRKTIKIGTHYKKKKLNPILKEWKASGYPIIWKKKYEHDKTVVRGKNWRKTHWRKVKRPYYDIYTKIKTR